MTYGIHVALGKNADVKNDLHRFDSVSASGYTQTGFRLDGLNAKGLTFTGCICQGLPLFATNVDIPVDKFGCVGRRCLDTSAVAGHGPSFYWDGGTALGHRDADFVLGDRTDPVLISGVFSEKSNRFLRARDAEAPTAGEPFPVTVEGIRFATGNLGFASDGEAIQFFSSGPLTVSGGRWGSERGARVAVRFRLEKGPDPAAYVFLGNYIVSTNRDLFPAHAPTDDIGNVVRIRPVP
jgi:hypothetical protein